MRARNLLLAGWASMPGALKQACLLGAVALLALGFLPGRAAAQTTDISGPSCPTSPVSGVVNLTGNINVTTAGTITTCITVGADGTTLNLNGHRIDITTLGDSVAIDTGTWSNVTINGLNSTTNAKAIIDTEYSTNATTAAIKSSGGANLSISNVIVNNEVSGNPCQPSASATNGGTGILLSGVTGANISSNTVDCYQVGISVQGSNITSHGGGLISGNDLYNNFYSKEYGADSTVNSAGLVLSNSSGWTVNGNTIDHNGSADANDTCVSNSTTPMSCAFGLQVIGDSSNNSISSNPYVDSNYGGGIYTGPATSKNTISGNSALSNGPVSNPFDLWDDAPLHANHWHHNTCATFGGSVPSHAC